MAKYIGHGVYKRLLIFIAIPGFRFSMSLQPISVMLIDESEQRSDHTRNILQATGCRVIASLTPDQDLLEEVERHQPDMVIVDIDLPDRDILENLRTVQSSLPKPMIMFSQDDNGGTIRRAVEAGVSAYVVDGIKNKQVRPILDAAIASFDQFQNLREELESTRAELQNRKSIDRAKGILMKQRKLDEPEAYRLLRKTAMDQKKTIAEIANQIVATAELLGV